MSAAAIAQLYENIATFLVVTLLGSILFAIAWHYFQGRKTKEFVRKDDELERLSREPQPRSSYPCDGGERP
jgi:predicted negative regulator of RcsB-dependent stress response